MGEACEEPGLLGSVAAKAATFRLGEVARTKDELVHIAGNGFLKSDVGRAISERGVPLSFVVGICCSVGVPSHNVCLQLADVDRHRGQMAADDIGLAFCCDVVNLIHANPDTFKT